MQFCMGNADRRSVYEIRGIGSTGNKNTINKNKGGCVDLRNYREYNQNIECIDRIQEGEGNE